MSEEKCPKCNGVPTAPEIPECRGCLECDFHGTREGYDNMQAWIKEGYEAEAKAAEEHKEYIKRGVCSGCGATSSKEAASKCKPHSVGETGEYSCAGEDLWPEEE